MAYKSTLALLAVLALCLMADLAHCQKYCSFNGPRDRPTLQGVNYISNHGTGDCLKLERYGVNNRIPIILDSCKWDSRHAQSDQIFTVKNSGSGSVVQPAQTSASNLCIATHDGKLSTKLCVPKSDEQTWKIQSTYSGQDYQVIQVSSGRCLKVNSGFGTNNVVLAPCNNRDKLQLWRICTAN